MKRFSLFGAPLLALALMLAVFGGTALAQDTTIDVELGEWYVDMPTTIPAGPVTLNVTNVGDMPHRLAIQGEGIDQGDNLATDESGTLQIDLEPGTYTFICPIPGHAEAGMSIQVTVQAAQADPTPVPADPTPVPADPTPVPADPTPVPADATPAPADPAATPTELPGVPATGVGGGSSDGNTTLIALLALAAGVAAVGGGLIYRTQRRAG